jgi:dinuclear metal center YbgI/SA1388 family protein
MKRDDLIKCLDLELLAANMNDYTINGLQVEGSPVIHGVMTAVTASAAAIAACVAADCNTLLVHHGYFWKNESLAITGAKYRRIKALLDHDINLIAYHLPLDKHPTLGNNVQLARVLDLQPVANLLSQPLLYGAELMHPMPASSFALNIGAKLGRMPITLGPADKSIHSVAICTGAAASAFHEAAALGYNAFITGETSEAYYHLAHEMNCVFFAAGHHATERYGIQALGAWLAETTDLRVQFFDEPNPI